MTGAAEPVREATGTATPELRVCTVGVCYGCLSRDVQRYSASPAIRYPICAECVVADRAFVRLLSLARDEPAGALAACISELIARALVAGPGR